MARYPFSRLASAVVLAASFSPLMAVAPASAGAELQTCIAELSSDCAEALSARMEAIAETTREPDAPARMRMQASMTLAVGKRFGEAEALADTMPSGYARDQAYNALVFELSNARRFDEARRVLHKIEEASYRANGRSDLITNVARFGGAEAALAVLEGTEAMGAPLQPYAVTHLVQALLKAGQAETALRVTEQQLPLSARSDIYQMIAIAQAADGQPEATRTTLARIDAPLWQVIANARVAAELAGTGQGAEAAALYDHAAAVYGTLTGRDLRSVAQTNLMEFAVRGGAYDFATALARGAEAPVERHAMLRMLAGHMAEKAPQTTPWRALFTEAEALLPELAPEDDPAGQRALLAVALVRGGQADWGLKVALAIEEADRRGVALEDLAMVHRQMGADAAAVAVYGALDDPARQAEGIARIAFDLERAGAHARAQEVMAQAEAAMGKAEEVEDFTLYTVAQQQAAIGNIDQAVAHAATLDDQRLRLLADIYILRERALKGGGPDYEAGLADLRRRLGALTDAPMQAQMVRDLANQLLMAERVGDAVTIPGLLPEGAARDEVLGVLCLGLGNTGHFAAAFDSLAGIGDPQVRLGVEHMVLGTMLRRALAAN